MAKSSFPLLSFLLLTASLSQAIIKNKVTLRVKMLILTRLSFLCGPWCAHIRRNLGVIKGHVYHVKPIKSKITSYLILSRPADKQKNYQIKARCTQKNASFFIDVFLRHFFVNNVTLKSWNLSVKNSDLIKGPLCN